MARRINFKGTIVRPMGTPLQDGIVGKIPRLRSWVPCDFQQRQFSKKCACGAANFAIFQNKIVTIDAVFKNFAPAARRTLLFSYKKIVAILRAASKLKMHHGSPYGCTPARSSLIPCGAASQVQEKAHLFPRCKNVHKPW